MNDTTTNDDKPISEKPILFSDAMVNAILGNGRRHPKIHTRRVVTPQPTLPEQFCCFTAWNDSWSTHDSRDRDPVVVDEWVCPYGYAGTRLWVRECWTTDHARFYPNFPLIYRADGDDPLQVQGPDPEHPGQVYSPEQKQWYPFRWRPSIHMRREHSRITLEVERVWIEPLQDISEADAIAEGVADREAFRHLWNEINGERGFGWDVNPWVWVIEFKRIKP